MNVHNRVPTLFPKIILEVRAQNLPHMFFSQVCTAQMGFAMMGLSLG